MWKSLKMINTCLISASSHPPQWGQQCCPRCHTAPPSPLLSSGHFYTYALDLSEWPVPFYETCSRSDLESTTDNLRLSKQLKKVKPREQKSLAGALCRRTWEWNGKTGPAPEFCGNFHRHRGKTLAGGEEWVCTRWGKMGARPWWGRMGADPDSFIRQETNNVTAVCWMAGICASIENYLDQPCTHYSKQELTLTSIKPPIWFF